MENKEKTILKRKYEGVDSQGRQFLDIGEFLKEINFKEKDLPLESDFEGLDLSPKIKAEVMWNLLKDVKIGILKRDRLLKKNKEKEKDYKLLEDEDLKQDFVSLKKFWEDEEVREIYKKEYNRHLKEEKIVNGDYQKYRSLLLKDIVLKENFDKLSAQIFAQRGQKQRIGSWGEYNKIKLKLNENKEKLNNLLGKYWELKARAKYEQLVDYERQLKKNNFIDLPSRRDVLEKLETAVISGRPILIRSESGAGKTTLIERFSLKLTGKEVSRIVGGSDINPEKLFATKGLNEKGSYYRYEAITEAITGKESEKDKEPKHSGHIVLDDEYNIRTSEHQLQIMKIIAGIKLGKKFNIPNTNIKEEVQPQFAYIAAGNPLSSRYERQETDIAAEREFGSNKINLDYPEQIIENPEIFSLLLVGLMSNGRLYTNNVEEMKPKFIQVDKKWQISSESKDGGFLWRFANAWRTLFDSFQHKENYLSKSRPADPKEKFYLDKLLLDMGEVLVWLKEYQRNLNQISLEEFLSKKMNNFIKQADEENDKELAKDIFKHFDIDLEKDFEKEREEKEKKQDKDKDKEKEELKVLTPQDIGSLFIGPKIEKEIILERGKIMLAGDKGIELKYLIKKAEEISGFEINHEFEDINGKKFTFKGIRKENGKYLAVLENEDKLGEIFPLEDLKDNNKFKIENKEKKETTSIEQAKEIFKENFYGKEQIKKALGFEIPKNIIPEINRSPEELEKLKEAGYELVLHIKEDNEGNKITGKQLLKIMAKRMRDNKLLYSQKSAGSPELKDDCRYKDEKFFKENHLKTEWRVMKKEEIPNTRDINHVEQTRILRDHLEELGVVPEEISKECSGRNIKRMF
jgi:hypothetical protein